MGIYIYGDRAYNVPNMFENLVECEIFYIGHKQFHIIIH